MLDSSKMNVIIPHYAEGGDWLTPTALAALTPEIVRQRIIELQPLIRTHAREAEELRRPADEVIAALRASGYFYLLVPKAYGGLGATPEQLADATIPIGEACASTAWVSSFVAVHNWLLGHFPEQALRETWGGAFPYIFAPAVTNPPGRAERVDGGYRVNGRWKFGTGVMHADWIIAFALLETDSAPELGMVLLPAREARVIDTWYTDGMCATGSHDILIEDVIVPEYRTVPLAPIFAGKSGAAERLDSDIFATPAVPLLTFAAALSVIGAAKEAVAAITKRLSVHKWIGETVAQAEKPISQARLGRADLLVKTGELLIRSGGRALLGYKHLSESEQLQARLLWRVQFAEGLDLCHQAIKIACTSAGSSLHFLDNPLQRIMRDVSVQATHVSFDLDTAYEQHGRSLVGLPPSAALY